MSANDALSLTMATGYHGRARPLWEERVPTGNLHLTIVPMANDGERFHQFDQGAFDAAEYSLGMYLSLKARNAPVVALPVFPNRRFRQSFIFVTAASGLHTPNDLKGKRVGIPFYGNTGALWTQGLLQDEYGLAVQDVRWLVQRAAPDVVLPPGVQLEMLVGKQTLCERLLAGEIDAAFARGAQFEVPGVRRLFASAKDMEKAYYARTKVFPIDHAVVVRKHLIEQHPELGQQLFDVTLEDDTDSNYSNFIWIQDLWHEERALFGPDAWPYGITRNQPTIEALIRYGVALGLLKENIEPSALFYPVME
jgi:4,5-dihydroxyphthalate decarboxylase